MTRTEVLDEARQIAWVAQRGLTASQSREVAEHLDAGEALLAVETVVDFLTDNDRPVARALFDRALAALHAMGSARTDVPHLRSLVVET